MTRNTYSWQKDIEDKIVLIIDRYRYWGLRKNSEWSAWKEGRLAYVAVPFPQEKNWKSKLYNLNFQCLLLRNVKLNIILQYFENQKLKIENGQLVVLTFCFQFPPP